jgi:Fe-S-cluster-containing hydrogenase component 2
MIITNPQACPQNHACPAARYYPAGAIVQDDIYSAPRIDRGLCTECGACSQICGRVFTQVFEEVGVR